MDNQQIGCLSQLASLLLDSIPIKTGYRKYRYGDFDTRWVQRDSGRFNHNISKIVLPEDQVSIPTYFFNLKHSTIKPWKPFFCVK